MELFKSYIQRLAKEKNVHALIGVLKDSGWSTSKRLAAISALGEMSNLQAVEALIEALKDSDSRVRQTAAATLGQLGYTHAMESLVAADDTQSALLAVAQQDWDWAVSLGSAALVPLVSALTDNKYWVRQRAVTALGQLGDPRALEPLLAALGDRTSGIRQQAATALGQLGDPRALEPLLAALKDNGDRWVRYGATT